MHRVQLQQPWSRLGQPQLSPAGLWALAYIKSTLGERADSEGIEEITTGCLQFFFNIKEGEGYKDKV